MIGNESSSTELTEIPINGSSASLALPGVTRAPGPALTSPAPPAKGRGIQPLASLLRHKFLALGIVTIMTVLAVPGAMVLGKHRFYTEAAFMVSPRFVKNLTADQELELQSNTQYREFVQQQVKTVNRFDIVYTALQKMGERRTVWQLNGETDRGAAERLAGNIQIKPVPDTYLVTVGLEADKKDGLADVVNSVLQSFMEQAKADEFYDSDDRITMLKAERAKVLESIKDRTAKRTEIAGELGTTTFNESLSNPFDQLLIKAKDALDAAKRNRIDIEAGLASLEQKSGGLMAVDSFAQEFVDKDAGLNGLKANLNQRRANLLQKLSGLTPEHPGRKAVENELGEIDSEIARATGVLLSKFREMLLSQKRSAVAQARQTERDLALEVENVTTRARDYSAKYSEALGIGIELDRDRKRVNTINDRIDYLALETNAPGFVRIVTPAREPLSPSKSGHKKSFIMLFLVGCVLALIFPMAVDFIDPRIHVPGELQKLAGFPPLASLFDKNEAGVDTVFRDQLVRLATSIDRDAHASGTRVIVLTSSKASEGTTTLAFDLANTLDELGVRTLVVEANRFKPDARYRDEIERDGLIDLLDGHASIEDIVVPRNEESPDRIGVGNIEGRAHLGGIDAFSSVLQQINRLYPIVLIDTAPLLLSAETEMMVGLADATLLVIQAAGISKAEIRRAVRTLERLAPPIVGTILVRMKIFKGGGYAGAALKEHSLAKRLKTSKLSSPWLWK